MSTESRLDDLLQRWDQYQRRGEPITPEELCRACPELLPAFRDAIAALQLVDHLMTPTLSPNASSAHPTASEAAPSPLPDINLQPGAEPVQGYRLVHRLGQGGFGEVWKATGPGGFPVALKFVRLVDRIGDSELQALQIIKEIRHPNLLSTFGAWQTPGHLIIAMELADRTLGDRCREAREQGLPGIPGPELLEYFREAAKGIDFLNEPRHRLAGKENLRVQHRDIKPHNILLVGGGVKVADFGLARLLEHTMASHSGSMSAGYAAPEFFRGQTSSHSDQYSLAVTYCQLRGGRLPFEGSREQVMAGHLLNAPDLTMVPEEERPVVAQALAKDPAQRWPHCRAFVDALARSMYGLDATDPDATPAPRPADSAPAPLPKPAEMSPLTWMAMIVALVVLAGTPTWLVLHFWPSGKSTEPSTQPALASPSVSSAPRDSKADINGEEKKSVVIPEAKVGELLKFTQHQGAVRAVTCTPKSGRVLSAGDDGVLQLWDPATGKVILSFQKRHTGAVNAVAVSADERFALSGSEDKTVCLWDLETGQSLKVLKDHTESVYCVAFLPNEDGALSSGMDCTIRRWDLQTGKQVKQFATPGQDVWGLAVDPQGRFALSTGPSPIVSRWDLANGTTADCFRGHADVVWSVALDGKGERAVSGGGDQGGQKDYTVRLWEVESGRELKRFSRHTAAVGCVAFSPDGRRILSGSADTTVRLWDAETGEQLYCGTGHSDRIHSVAFTPDGRLGLSAGGDGTVRVWSLPK
jgi:WD40 repeat protein